MFPGSSLFFISLSLLAFSLLPHNSSSVSIPARKLVYTAFLELVSPALIVSRVFNPHRSPMSWLFGSLYHRTGRLPFHQQKLTSSPKIQTAYHQ